MSLQTNLTNLATRIATVLKGVRADMGALTGLTTVTKTNLVAAINELDAAIDAVAQGSGAINDGTVSPMTTWSSARAQQFALGMIKDDAGVATKDKTWSADKIVAAIAAAKNEITNGASTALDTLAELAAAMGNDPGFATTITNALGKRVRVDQAQSFTSAEKLQACNNMGIGDPETDLVTAFNAGLV